MSNYGFLGLAAKCFSLSRVLAGLNLDSVINSLCLGAVYVSFD